MKGHLDIKQLESMKKADLQELANQLGVSNEGTVKEIAARCAEVEVDAPEEDELTEEEKAAAAAAQAEHEAKEAAAKASDKVKVKANQTFLDKQRGVIVKKGESFDVTKERAEQLKAAKVVD